jgi:N-methylhydantoinase A
MPDSRVFSLVGIDVGGTFTDFVLLRNGRLMVHKVATTPEDQSRAIVTGLHDIGLSTTSPTPTGEDYSTDYEIVHGTTVATNALLEHRGARTALLTTAGFRDVLVIGRQNRAHLYRLTQERPPALVPDELRFEVTERVDYTGAVLTPLDEEEVTALAQHLAAANVESVAVVFLFSFQNPEHERRAARILRRHLPGIPISLSSDILPEYREYERTSTTVINAYLQPVVGRYLDHLSTAVPGRNIRIMQSNGGAIGLNQAVEEPARLVLSGPAGGVVGAHALAQQAAEQPDLGIITFDMGGTSTDVALCPAAIPRTSESEIADLPLRLPIIDIHTVGAGGGSLAHLDVGGGLRVGPQSAGAVPGPVCYGRGGTEPTVTDANLVLGRLDPGHFLGGRGDVRLDEAAAQAALGDLGRRLGGISAEEAALGVIRVANATMERALRRVSVERGYDPREFTLVPFGGAGPLHACDLADALGIQRIFIPPHPGVLSALGLLLADIIHEVSHAVLADAAELTQDPGQLEALFERLAAQVTDVLQKEGVRTPVVDASLDMRYRGQSYELTVPLGLPVSADNLGTAVANFHQTHARRYGYAMDGEPVEVVTLRVRGIGPGAQPTFEQEPVGQPDPSAAYVGDKPVWFQATSSTKTACYERERLAPGNRLDGPANIYQFDTTITVTPGWRARVDGWRNLWLERAATD